MRFLAGWALALATITGLAACQVPRSTSDDTTTTVGHTVQTDGVVRLTIPRAGVGQGWNTEFSIQYGLDLTELGRDSETGVGPEFGDVADDGTWWIIDVNKHRVARYTASGRFLGAIAIPGRYAGVQLPCLLDDRTLFAAGKPALLVADNVATRPEFPLVQSVFGEHGSCYASSGEGLVRVVRHDASLTIEHVDGLPLPSGSTFDVRIDPSDRSRIVVTMHGSTERKVVLQVAPEGSAEPMSMSFEIAVNGDTIVLLVYGASGKPGSEMAYSGLIRVTEAGQVLPVTSTPVLFSVADSGSPSHLRANAKGVFLVLQLEDALHVLSLKS